MSLKIREALEDDFSQILALNRLAFAGESEASLIEALKDGNYIRASLIAEEEGRLIGHILFSEIGLEESGASVPVLALAPMAVHPKRQRQGIGMILVQEGLEYCQGLGYPAIFVLGHPDFYDRLGFSAELAAQFSSPYSGPAFMAFELVSGFLKAGKGRVIYSRPFLSLED